MKLVTAERMRALEEKAEAAGVSTAQLMENAGLAVAQEAWLLLGTPEDRRIVVLVGPGNNGGDGLVAARHLADWQAVVTLYLARARQDDPLLEALAEPGVKIMEADRDTGFALLKEALGTADLVIDALLGTGQARPIDGTFAAILDRLSDARRSSYPPKLLAVDLPSGVASDTGAVDVHSVRADTTVTFGVAKVGLFCSPGDRYTGRVQVAEIGIPIKAQSEVPVSLLDESWVKRHLPERPLDSNKGTFGKVLAAVGSRSFVGAAFLSAAGAYRSGAGLVTLAVPESIQLAVVPMLPEATYLPLPDAHGILGPGAAEAVAKAVPGYDVLLLGCGLTQEAPAQAFVQALLRKLEGTQLGGVVVDADALNALAASPDWPQWFQAMAVLTPHPGEFARLAGTTVATIQSDRLGIAQRFATEWHKVVVLKGANTVVAAPDGQSLLSPFANPALATAGTGDVLAGTIAGLLAQGLSPYDAAATGVYLHAVAGSLLRSEFGDAGGLAGDLPRLLPEARRQIVDAS